MTKQALIDLFNENGIPLSDRNAMLYDDIMQSMYGAKWEGMESIPKQGDFLVYMPEEFRKYQVAYYRPNVNVIGNAFAFDLTQPTLWAKLPPLPKGF